jgi:hypothetical protein
MLLAKVLVPLTMRLELPVVLVIAGLVPLILSEPTVRARCKSKVALLIVSKLNALPSVPVLVSTKAPALTVVAPL